MNKEMSPPHSRGLVATVRATPGWVWVLVGGVVLLIVGVLAAQAALPREEDFG